MISDVSLSQKFFASFFLLFVEFQSFNAITIYITEMYLKLCRKVNKELFRNVNKERINIKTDYLFMKMKIKDDLLLIFYEMKASKN